jgi:nanoRNase/pAp phosphatase (c-di-AMP/oligoRNAs hydrolase)
MIYALNPEATVSIHVLPGKQNQNTVLAVGKSIFNKTNGTDIGALMLRYGGGGHRNAGTCQVEHGQANRVLAEVADALNGHRAVRTA